jgi:hypothetical protein
LKLSADATIHSGTESWILRSSKGIPPQIPLRKERSVPKVVKPLWAALRGRDTAISQRQGKKDGKHYD